MKPITRVLLLVAGTVCVVLGILGMILPVLPTTPFLLLASYCFARSSTRFHTWLITNRWCGEYIRNYRAGRGIPLRHKIVSITFLWLMMGYTIAFAVSLWWVRLILAGIAAGVTVHLVKMKTFKPEAYPPEWIGERVSQEELD